MRKLILFIFVICSLFVGGRNKQSKPSYVENLKYSTNETFRTFYYYNNKQNVVRVDYFKDTIIVKNDSSLQSIRLLNNKETFVYDKKQRLVEHKTYKIINYIRVINNIPIIYTKTTVVLEEKLEYER